MHAKIMGTGSFLPKRVVLNDDLSKILETSDEWISSRTGIKQRHVADVNAGETCSNMGYEAALKALEMAKLSPSDLDLIIVATVSPDYRLPSAACLIQAKLGAKNVPAFDISAACSGSIYGLSVADSFIRSGKYKNILFISVEILSSLINWQDRNTAVLFGDGASAAVLSACDKNNSGFLDFQIFADGAQQETIFIKAGGSKLPHTLDTLDNGLDKIIMNGRETFKFAVRSMCDAIENICLKNKVKAADFSYVVPHQANLRIIEAIAERIDVPIERFLINLDRCANTSAASLLLAYDEANRAHKLNPGDLILMLAMGAGFTWGAGIYCV